MQYYAIGDAEISVYLVEKYGADEVARVLDILEEEGTIGGKSTPEEIRDAVDEFFTDEADRKDLD